MRATPTDTLREVERFVYREARLADEHAYEEWEALWAEDGVYWVPADALPFGPGGADPERTMSIIYDNRARIATRIKQLRTGRRHSATPPPRVRRVVGNVELLAEEPELQAGANFVAYESRERGVTLWAGRVEYLLRRRADGELAMAHKHVFLVNNDRPLDTLSFLI